MRFGTLYIDGFGMHRNRTFELDPRAPLVLFTGRNEAGKSTVMGFIRAMLFGFPTRARPAERYEPFGGGPHGGWLTLIDGRIGEIRLERYDGKGYPILHFPDGTQGGEAELAALLAGLTPDLYRNLFAFSLSELARLETLQGDEISGFLYGSGAGVSGSAVVQAEKRLAAAMDELYKRQGRKQPIHEKLRELEKLEAELRRSREAGSAYNELKRRLDGLDARIGETERRVKALRAEADWLDKCMHAQKPWRRIREIEREWAEAPERYRVPPEAEALLADRADIARLLDGAARLARSRGEAAELRKQLETERSAMEQLLRRIDPSWTIEDARRFPFDVVRQEEVEAFRSRFDRLAAAVSAVRERLASLDAERDELARGMERAAARVRELEQAAAACLPPAAAEDPDGFAASLRQAWTEVRESAAALSEAARRRAESERMSASFKESARRAPGPAGPAAAVLTAALAVAATAAVWLWTREWAAAAVAGALALLAGVAALRFAPGRRGDDPLDDVRRTWAFVLAQAERDEEEAAARAGECLGRLLDLLPATDGYREAAAAAQSADPREAVKLLAPVMDGLEREMAAWRRQLGELEKARDALAAAGNALEAWRGRREREAARFAALEEELADCRREWADWLAGFRLPGDLKPESLKLMGEYAERALDKAAQLAGLEARIAALAEEEAACRKAALALLEKHAALAGLRGQDPDGLLPYRDGAPAGAAPDAAAPEPGRGEEPGRDPEPGREPASAAGTEPDDAPAPASGAENGGPDDWPERLSRLAALADGWKAVSDRRDAMELERRQQRRLLEEWIPEDKRDDLERTLAACGPERLAELLAEAETRTAEAEAELGRLKEERGRLKAELEQLESGERHAGLLLENAAREAELGQLLEQYAVRAMAALLIRKARDIHERERQPGVLLRASRHFERITGGRYVRVLSPMGEKDLLAEAKDGRRLSSARLSRGTAEQLYLAMRLALADEYERILDLPLVMDDIFVNFDGARLRETLGVVAEVARRRQILLFTCHEHVAEAVKAAVPDLQLIELDHSS